jgi:hypothetical protein
MNEDYVIIKLLSGENVVSEVLNESDYDITLENPMVLQARLREKDGSVYESISAVPFCPFSLDTIYVLKKSNVLFIKPLNPEYIVSYIQMIDKIDNKALQSQPSSVEEVESILDRIQELMGIEEESDSIELEGNKIIH